jgi:hypothetical protein
VSFADPLREALLALHPSWDLWHFGPGKDLVPPDGGLSPRELMRALGDWVKWYVPGFFIEAAYRAIAQHFGDGRHVVIDDVRFEAEADWIRSCGGYICHVSRTDVVFRRDHNSEMGIEPRPGDLHLRNWGGVQSLSAEIVELLLAIKRAEGERGWPCRAASPDGGQSSVGGDGDAGLDDEGQSHRSRPYPWP